MKRETTLMLYVAACMLLMMFFTWEQVNRDDYYQQWDKELTEREEYLQGVVWEVEDKNVIENLEAWD